MGKVTYRKEWEAEFTRSAAGRTAFVGVADDIADDTRRELKRTGLVDDPPAREYIEAIHTEATASGARVWTDASRAHFVEFGTLYRDPDAPMRTAAARYGKFTER